MLIPSVLIVEGERLVAKDLPWRLRRLGDEGVGNVASGEAAIEQAQTPGVSAVRPEG